jgi:hypothetical protein
LVGHPQQTDDLVQDALAKAWSSIKAFDGRSTFSTWLWMDFPVSTWLWMDFHVAAAEPVVIAT